MRKIFLLCLSLLLICAFPVGYIAADTNKLVKLSVFNFGTVNLDASGYGTTVTNMLLTSLAAEPSLTLLDRRELESFLSLNDLQQNDVLDNVVTIGTRLGLDMIVVGSVETKGGIIIINAKVIHISQKKTILNTQVRALGDTGLLSEVRNLSQVILKTVIAQAGKQLDNETTKIKEPINLQKRAGSKRVQITWEDPPDNNAVGYEVFRGASDKGPFIKIANTNQLEYLDQNMESNTTYYYKIRSYNNKGIQSDYSAVIVAETALTPNPPVILKTEGHIKSIQLTWSPNPIASEDPLKIKGYKLYRAKTEQGPYREVDLGLGLDGTTAMDKLLKITNHDRGLADGEDYYYKLTAYNEKDLESEFSLGVKGTTIPAVTELTAQGDMIREIKLAWNPIHSPFIKGYYIYRSTTESGNFTKIKRIDSENEGKIQYIDKDGLGDNITYCYRVTAYEATDTETSPSITVSAVTKGKPPVPEGLKALSGLVKKVDLVWTASPLAEVEGYNIYRSQEKFGKYSFIKRIDGRENNKFTDGRSIFESLGGGLFESLGDNTSFYYAIKSFNKVGVESDISEVVSAQTKSRPLKPSSFKGENLKVKSVPLEWVPNPEKDIKSYNLYRSLGPAGVENFTRIAIVDKTSYVDGDLKDGNTYLYKIQAEDKDGLLSDFSDTVVIQTKPKPQSPEGLKGKIQGGKVQISWMPGQEADIVNYVVYEKTFFRPEKITVVKEPNFSEISPSKGKTKTYIVTAIDKDGLESDFSREIIMTGE